MPNLSSIVAPDGVVTANNELELRNKTLTDPVVNYSTNGGSFTVPSGTTAERPTDSAIGAIRFNTDENELEQYDGSNWNTVELTDQEIRSLFNADGDLIYDSATGEFSVTTTDTPDQVLKPVLLSPTDGETDIGETPTLDAGDYYHLYDRPHTLSRFQVSDDSQFNNIVYDSGEIAATQTHTVPAGNLQEGQVTYYWRAYYEDDAGNQSEFSDPFEFVTLSTFFDYTDPANIGTAVDGGFLVGVIDTVAGTIDSQDDYQTGERYALVVAPKSLETGTATAWDSQNRNGEPGSFTRWDGLSSTNSILAKNDTSYEAFEHIRSIRSSNPVPSDDGSDWYLPAMDELELIYRNFKPFAQDNDQGTETSPFPGSQDFGFNPSSDPTGSAYTTTGEPFQTSVTDFQNGGTEVLDADFYWSSTDSDEANPGRGWYQNFADSFGIGRQAVTNKDFNNIDGRNFKVRPVRRVPL